MEEAMGKPSSDQYVGDLGKNIQDMESAVEDKKERLTELHKNFQFHVDSSCKL